MALVEDDDADVVRVDKPLVSIEEVAQINANRKHKFDFLVGVARSRGVQSQKALGAMVRPYGIAAGSSFLQKAVEAGRAKKTGPLKKRLRVVTQPPRVKPPPKERKRRLGTLGPAFLKLVHVLEDVSPKARPGLIRAACTLLEVEL